MADYVESAKSLARQLTPLGQLSADVFRSCKDDEFALIEQAASGPVMSSIDKLPIEAMRYLYAEWERSSQIEIGEIYGLIDFCDGHRDAVAADLIDRGLRLRNVGTPELDWRDLAAVVATTTKDRSSALFRELYPEYVEWDLGAHLAADAVDLLHLLVWFKTKDGSKGRNRPKPYPRPGVEDADKSKKVRKGDVITLDAARDLFALPSAN